ncbi:MAG: RagB/SusD family nutrient uptake outer membrane protein [Adhaeribacter sp.]
MKKISISLLCAALATSFFSCEKEGDFLDKTQTTELNRQKVFSDSTLTLEFLTKSYADMAFNWEYRKYASTRNGNTDVTDDGISSSSSSGAFHPIVTGALSAANESPYTTSWSVPYDNIRALNVFLAYMDQAPLSAGKKVQLRAEARFLRAWYYAQLVRYFGGVPILGDQLLEIDHDFAERRSSYAEAVSYIVSELDAAAKDLPRDHTGIDFGRVTKGAALALKTRVLLYAASPLFNGGNIGQEIAASNAEQVSAAGYPAYDENRWLLARRAAEEVIALGQYGLYEDPAAATNPPGYSFSRVFLRRRNNEYILQYNLPQNRDMETNFLTPSRSSATYSMPTHNLALAFGMINGLPISDPASGYDPQNPFANRDPRFNYTLIYNGTLWHNGQTNNKTPILTQLGAKPDGFGEKTHHTGYYWRKMMEENTAPVGGTNTERCLPLIRYAEILLALAEASNELNDQATAYAQLKLIRQRAGILPGADNSYGLKVGMNKEQMRQVIQQERRVEFVFEEHRFWDLRRWKIAEQTLNGLQLLALKTTPLAGGKFKHEELPINHANSKLVFLKPNHLFPIPQSEINRNGNLVQNPGY